MTDPFVHELLREPYQSPPGVPDLPAAEQQLLQALVVLGGLLSKQPEVYRELLHARTIEGPTPQLRERALEAAGALGAALWAARRHQQFILNLESTSLKANGLVAIVDQLFDAFVLLATVEDEPRLESLLASEEDLTELEVHVEPTWRLPDGPGA